MHKIQKVKGWEQMSNRNQGKLQAWLHGENIIEKSEMANRLPREAFKEVSETEIVRDMGSTVDYEEAIERSIDALTTILIITMDSARQRIDRSPFTLEIKVVNSTVANGMEYRVEACFGVYS